MTQLKQTAKLSSQPFSFPKLPAPLSPHATEDEKKAYADLLRKEAVELEQIMAAVVEKMLLS